MLESKVPIAVVKRMENGGLVYMAQPDPRFIFAEQPVYRETISAGVAAELQGKKPVVVFARDDQSVIIDDLSTMERMKGFLIGINADGVICPEERAAASRVITEALGENKQAVPISPFAVEVKAS